MLFRFSERVALVDRQTDNFLETIANLGGYCTADQAMRLGLAASATRVHARLDGLEQLRFLSRITSYPLVYQVTKSVTRLMGCDLMARRSHPITTITRRLLAVNFYIEALGWPAEFVFDHDEKVAAFKNAGCSEHALPHRGGAPYLWEDFVLKADGKLCIAIIDRAPGTALLQARGLASRYFQCFGRGPAAIRLLVVVSQEARERLYKRLATHPKLRSLVRDGTPLSIATYRVRLPVPLIQSAAESRRNKR